MNIFFDHQTFAQQQYGGISRYFCELVTGINKTNTDKAHLSVLWSNNVHLQEYNLPIWKYPFPKRHRLFHKSNRLYNQLDCSIRQFDVYHATYFDDFLISQAAPKPCITTFYDMIYERLSHEFVELSADKEIINQKRKMAQRASHLIAISESTKQDMIELMDIPPEKISVIYLGSPFPLANVDPITYPATVERPYLLYVGKRFQYKNFTTFLKSVAHLLKKYQVNVLCAGGGEFTKDEISLFDSLAVREYVEYTNINDKILQELYRQAVAFVFPSLYEGFGIPVLEAFSCNCPCIVSNTSSLPEVAGDAALYIDPKNHESIAHAVEQVLTSDSLRTDLIQRGRKRLGLFSWQQTVDETLMVYKKFL